MSVPDRNTVLESAAGTSGWERYAVAALLLLHALVCWLARPIGYLTGQDDLEYVVLGQSLRDGGYNMLFRADQALHAQYPPGYPAMLALWGWIPGDSFTVLAVLSMLLSVGVLLLTWFAVRKVFGGAIAIATLAVLAVNPSMVGVGGNVASEVPFMLLVMAALLLLVGEERQKGNTAWIVALAVLAALTRSIGITLIGAIGLHWLLRREWKRAAILAAASLIFVGPWMLWTFTSPEVHVGSSYVADLQVAVSRAAEAPTLFGGAYRRLIFYATRAAPYALAIPTIGGTLIDNVIVTAFLAVALTTGCWLLWRRWRVASLALLAYGGLLLVWTWRTERFLIPLLPIAVPAILAAVSLPFLRRWPRLSGGLLGALTLLLIGGGAARTSAVIADRVGCRDWDVFPPAECVSPDQASYFAAIEYVRDAVPPEDIILAGKPAALWYYSGHPTASYPAATAQAPDEWVPYLKEQGVSWVLLSVLEQAERRTLATQVEANCDSLILERSFPERTFLFRLRDTDPPADGEGGGDACEAVRQYRNAAGSAR